MATVRNYGRPLFTDRKQIVQGSEAYGLDLANGRQQVFLYAMSKPLRQREETALTAC